MVRPERTEEPVRLTVKALYDNDSSVDALCRLLDTIPQDATHVVLDMRNCSWIGQNATAVLGGIIRRLLARGVRVTAEFASEEQQVRRHLLRNGFLASFGWAALPQTGHAVPYRADARLDKDALTDYLIAEWIGKGWVHVSQKLSRAVAGSVCEIYVNAFEHSGSSVGVLSCGQHYPRLNQLRLSVVDLGVGIVENVRRFVGDPTIRADRALRWAFTDGKSTRQSTVSGGLGLGLLKEFVQVSGGVLEIHSNDGRVRISADEETYAVRAARFSGTLVTISLLCDRRYYRFADETPSASPEEP